jgi:acetate kinase
MTSRLPRAAVTLNRGSSSVKSALFSLDRPLRSIRHETIDCGDTSTLEPVLTWIADQRAAWDIVAFGHRLVHGGRAFAEPQRITDDVIDQLQHLIDFAPNHLPGELALIDLVRHAHPEALHVACFDTAFHRDLPELARRLPIPSRYDEDGIRAYGFHGLSCTFLLDELERVAGLAAASGRVILAHLGSGSSLTAVVNRRPVDTSMTFSPTSGLIMSTRSGDLDPALVTYVERHYKMTPENLEDLVTHSSGLLGISGTTGDMRELLQCEGTNPAARLAVDMYCYRIRKMIGAYAAVLGGLDTVVFSGGIGEHAPAVRARIARGLAFLGITIDPERNAEGAGVVSHIDGPITVRVIATDEEAVIARAVSALWLPLQSKE